MGNHNTANGNNALYNNTTGDDNAATGWSALGSNTTGYANTANGYVALYSNTTGTANTANGNQSLYSNTTGYANTANGSAAFYFNTTGIYNTAIGVAALYSNNTGSYNTALGYLADVSTGNLNNATAIGYNANVDASDKVRVGNTGVNSIGGQVGWSTFSDGRYKKNIKEDVKGLSFINSLRPITYTVDINSLNAYYDKGRKHDSAYEKMKADMQRSGDQAAKIVYNGFIAQDVEAAAKKLNYEFSGVDKPKTEDALYGLRYAEFVVPLVKAVQELSAKNDDLQKQIDELKAIILTGNQSSINLQSQTANNWQQTALLQQNSPNPFSNSTVIRYYIPPNTNNAQLIISDANGVVLKTIVLSSNGNGQATITAGGLSQGNYFYSLMIDGGKSATKQMIITK